MEYTRLKPCDCVPLCSFGDSMRRDCDWKAYDVLRPKIARGMPMQFYECIPLSDEKAFVCYSFPWKPFLAAFSSTLFVAHVEPLLTQYRVTFICERRDDARQRLSVLFKAGGSHVSVGNE